MEVLDGNAERTILAIDPGMETGLVVADVYPKGMPVIIEKVQVPDEGLKAAAPVIEMMMYDFGVDDVVCESFSPRPGERSWKLKELEPLRFEGWLVAHDWDITFRKPEARKLINGDLSATGGFLRHIGYWTLPSDIGRPDANDTNSAMMHLFGYLRDTAHMPTIRAVIEYGDHMHEGD